MDLLKLFHAIATFGYIMWNDTIFILIVSSLSVTYAIHISCCYVLKSLIDMIILIWYSSLLFCNGIPDDWWSIFLAETSYSLKPFCSREFEKSLVYSQQLRFFCIFWPSEWIVSEGLELTWLIKHVNLVSSSSICFVATCGVRRNYI